MRISVLIFLAFVFAVATAQAAPRAWYLQMLGGGFNSAVVFEFPTRAKCEKMKRQLIRNITSVKPKPTGRCTPSQPRSTTVIMSYR